VYIYIYVY